MHETESYKSRPVEVKERPGYAVEGAHQLMGTDAHPRQSGTSKLYFVASTELHWHPGLPVSPDSLLRCHCHRYNLLFIDLSLPQKSALSSDVTD